MPLSDKVTQLYPQALDFLFVVSYESQCYGGGILTRLHTGGLSRLHIYHISHPEILLYVAESSTLKWAASKLLFTLMAILLHLFRRVACGAACDYRNRNVNIWLSAWGRGARHTQKGLDRNDTGSRQPALAEHPIKQSAGAVGIQPPDNLLLTSRAWRQAQPHSYPRDPPIASCSMIVNNILSNWRGTR
jgi:hypothetical protein